MPMPDARPRPLAGRYRALLLDCDGVLYLGDQVIQPAPTALRAARALGCRLAFITNNSRTSPAAVAAKLTGMGIDAEPAEVFTSAQAVVRLLGPERVTGAKVLMLGGPGLRETLTEAGATLVEAADWRQAEIVVVGLDTELTYANAAGAALAIGAGARFAATNADLSLPSPDGPLPGAGSILALLSATTGRAPEVAGKPEPALFELVAAAAGPGPHLVVGDRADTDLAGAARLDWDTALVLTGITTPADLCDLPDAPTWVLRDLDGLVAPEPPAVRAASDHELPAARALLAGAGFDVAEAAGVAVAASQAGPLTGAVAWTTAAGGDGELLGPVVAPSARGALVGTRLVMAACAGLRGAGARRVLAAGPPAFLGPLGFVPASGPDRMARPLR
jgi:glycerol 3-phosphatase-2